MHGWHRKHNFSKICTKAKINAESAERTCGADAEVADRVFL